ncbi:MAG TPA: STAS domain-containing protein [Solirubrobacteraceae bacterium]|nr:STAS domain-containing protein [Solirubrobacteraceae bacterium]
MGSRLNTPQLTVERSEQDGVHLVTLSGELDLYGVPELETTLAQPGPEARICLDLTALEFIDSTGLATVIRAHQTLAAGDGAIAVVAAATGSVRRTLEMTGLTTLLNISADRATAVQSLGPTPR